jgi:D-serine deaminase-like pyridoxal phosphate-dependent protein
MSRYKYKDTLDLSTNYLELINHQLKEEAHGVPELIIDLDALDHNIQTLKRQWPTEKVFRLVVKSLPSLPLLKYITQQTNSHHFMAFHLPFLCQLVQEFPTADVLLGKPLPVSAAEKFYNFLSLEASSFDASLQLQWLIDTPERLNQYLSLAQKTGQPMAISIELDVGLHRGGVNNFNTLDLMLTTIRNHPKWLTFKGFMGYDAHVGKLPAMVESQQKSFQLSQQHYQSFIDYVNHYFPEQMEQPLTFNGAGSPTIELHKQHSLCNDLSIGSALLKPHNFDLPLLTEFKPASFIATPILKQQKGLKLPGPEWLSQVIQKTNSKYQQTYFIYGGGWKASFIDPRLKENTFYGESANQAIVNAHQTVPLLPDDYIFMRPKESEAVLLQFGDLLAYRNGQPFSHWPVLNQQI